MKFLFRFNLFIVFFLIVSAPMQSGTAQPREQVVTNNLPMISNNLTVAMAAGVAHTCSLTPSGGAKYWGSNAHGQLGIRPTDKCLIPVDVISFP